MSNYCWVKQGDNRFGSVHLWGAFLTYMFKYLIWFIWLIYYYPTSPAWNVWALTSIVGIPTPEIEEALQFLNILYPNEKHKIFAISMVWTRDLSHVQQEW